MIRILETIRVTFTQSGHSAIINKSDLDPVLHTLYDNEPEEPEVPEVPEYFKPARSVPRETPKPVAQVGSKKKKVKNRAALGQVRHG